MADFYACAPPAPTLLPITAAHISGSSVTVRWTVPQELLSRDAEGNVANASYTSDITAFMLVRSDAYSTACDHPVVCVVPLTNDGDMPNTIGNGGGEVADGGNGEIYSCLAKGLTVSTR